MLMTACFLIDPPEGASAAVIKVKERRVSSGRENSTETATTEFQLADKLSALEKLCKHLGMFVERVEHSGKVDLGMIL